MGVKVLTVSPELLAELLRQDGTRRIKIEGLPADAKLVAVSDTLYFDQDLFAFKVESEEFEKVPSGHAWPRLELQVSEVVERRGREFL